MIIRKPKLVTIKVIYHMPDYFHILQEFVWQHEDILPKFPKSHKFLNYWHKNIDGLIEVAELYTGSGSNFRKIDILVK